VPHLSDGALRRLYDEPFATGEQARAHYAACQRCQGRFAEIASEARESMELLAAPGVTVDAEAALARLRERAAPGRSLRLRPRLTRLWLPGVAAAAVGLLLVAGLAGAGAAQGLLKIFEPQQVAPLPVSTGELSGLPDLSAYGTVKVTQQPELKDASSAEDAASQSGLPAIRPAKLPAGIPTQATYGFVPQGSGSFTFDAAKARAAAEKAGSAMPSLPAGIQGSTLYLTAGPAEVALYGDVMKAAGGSEASSGVQQRVPALAVGAMKAPVVTSTGVTVQQLEDFLLAQPGVSPQLAAQIRALGDPTSTLPIPIPVDRAESHAVTVQGVQGVALGDDTGLGSAVIWEKDGVVWAVGGTVSESDALAVANSL
jgi:hypothetical protein